MEVMNSQVLRVPPDSAEVVIDFHECSVAEVLDGVHDDIRVFGHGSKSRECGHLAHGDPTWKQDKII